MELKLFEDVIFPLTNGLVVVIGTLGLAIIAAVIPFAVLNLQENSTDENNDFKELDKRLTIGDIIKVRNIWLSIILIYLPLAGALVLVYLWGFFLASHKEWFGLTITLLVLGVILFIAFCLVGLILLIRILIGLFRWVSGDKHAARINYLKSVTKPEEMKFLWTPIWELEGFDGNEEADFFEIFSRHIDLLVKSNNKDPELANILLGYYGYENRPIYTLSGADKISHFLEWYFVAYDSIEKHEMGSAERREWRSLRGSMEWVFKHITEIGLKHQSNDFFTHFGPHVQKYQTRNESYVRELLRNFYNIFIVPLNDNSYDTNLFDCIWADFPKTWKITKKNYIGQPAARILWEYFRPWISGCIAPSAKFDPTLDNVALNLFPDVNPSLWATFLTFIFTPDEGNLMQSLVGTTRIFGQYERKNKPSLRWEGRDRATEDDKEEKDTIELLLTLFPKDVKINKLDTYITELEALKATYKNKPNLLEELTEHYIPVFKRLKDERDRQSKSKKKAAKE